MKEAIQVLLSIHSWLLKYDPDQPRDEQGRWTSIGESPNYASFSTPSVLTNRIATLSAFEAEHQDELLYAVGNSDPIANLYKEIGKAIQVEKKQLKEGIHPISKYNEEAQDRVKTLLKQKLGLKESQAKLEPFVTKLRIANFDIKTTDKEWQEAKAAVAASRFGDLRHSEYIYQYTKLKDFVVNNKKLQSIEAELSLLSKGDHEIQHVGLKKHNENKEAYRAKIDKASSELNNIGGVKLEVTAYHASVLTGRATGHNLEEKDLKGIVSAFSDTKNLCGSTLGIIKLKVVTDLNEYNAHGIAFVDKFSLKKPGLIEISATSGDPTKNSNKYISQEERKWMLGERPSSLKPTYDFDSHIEGVARHEIGHFFLESNRTRLEAEYKNPSFVSGLGKISDYARTNIAEGVAENYTRWSANKNAIDKEVQTVFDSLKKDK